LLAGELPVESKGDKPAPAELGEDADPVLGQLDLEHAAAMGRANHLDPRPW
jgi:hypothetical protein